ncbi:hypothetical protein O59_000099 [Cellvibrio sp. BR]|nr:hypothetical protein O59_000099 [Cellvibrio sp. BR]
MPSKASSAAIKKGKSNDLPVEATHEAVEEEGEVLTKNYCYSAYTLRG